MTEITLDLPGALALVIQVVLPIVVGLITKQSWTARLKALLLLGLTAVTQFATAWYKVAVAHEHFDWKQTLIYVVVGLVVSTAMHYSVWRPTGVTAAAQNALVRDT